MSQRHYIVIGIEVPGHFRTGATPQQEQQSAARLVSGLLRDAVATRDIHVNVSDALALSPDDVDRIIWAMHREVERGAGELRELDAKMTELRRAVEDLVAQRKDRP